MKPDHVEASPEWEKVGGGDLNSVDSPHILRSNIWAETSTN